MIIIPLPQQLHTSFEVAGEEVIGLIKAKFHHHVGAQPQIDRVHLLTRACKTGSEKTTVIMCHDLPLSICYSCVCVCVCLCSRARARACIRACVRACVHTCARACVRFRYEFVPTQIDWERVCACTRVGACSQSACAAVCTYIHRCMHATRACKHKCMPAIFVCARVEHTQMHACL